MLVLREGLVVWQMSCLCLSGGNDKRLGNYEGGLRANQNQDHPGLNQSPAHEKEEEG